MADAYERKWRTYGGQCIDVSIPAVSSVLVSPKSVNRTVRVQRVVYTPSVWGVVTTLTFIDGGTGLIIGTLVVPDLPPATGNESDSFKLDYGPNGTSLSQNANLVLGIVGSTAGRLHVDAYSLFAPVGSL